MSLKKVIEKAKKGMPENRIKIMGHVIKSDGNDEIVYTLITQHDSIVFKDEGFKGFINQCLQAVRNGEEFKRKAAKSKNAFMA